MKRLTLVVGLALLLALAACNALQTPTQEALPTDMAPAETTGDGGTTEAGPAATTPAETAPPLDQGAQVIPSLPGTVWEWVDLTTPVETISAVDPARYTIEFMDDGTAAIKADCNQVQASYVADSSGAISLALGPSTLAACPADTQDQLFLGALTTVASYFAYETDAHLYLSQIADSGTLRFRPAGDAGGASTGLESAGDAATTLTGVSWEWVSTVDPMGQTAAADPTRYTITFNDDGTAAIKADCNNVPATYITDGTNLSLELGPSTLVGCPADSQDQLFLNGLGSVAAYTVEDGELFIALEADAGTLMFRQAGSVAEEPESPAGEAAAPELTGGTWEWVSTTTPLETVTAADPARYTITFNADGTAGIQADCNMAGGTYTTGEGNTLSVTMGPSTLMACPPDSQADSFLAGLAAAATYAFDGSDLLIDEAAGAGTLRFRLQGGTGDAGAGETAAPPAPPTKGEPGPVVPGQVAGLTGTSWQWTQLTRAAGNVAVTDPSLYTLTFNADGTVDVKADCNSGRWTYATGDGGMLTVTAGEMSAAFCGAGSLDQVFRGGLTNAMSYRLEEGGLSIDMLYESGSLDFTPAP